MKAFHVTFDDHVHLLVGKVQVFQREGRGYEFQDEAVADPRFQLTREHIAQNGTGNCSFVSARSNSVKTLNRNVYP